MTEAQRDRKRARDRAYYARNRGRVIARVKRWTLNNRKKVRKYKSDWIRRNPDYRRMKDRKWHAKNPHYGRSRSKRNVERLSDSYIAMLLKMPIRVIPRSILDAKRAQVALTRLVNQKERK